MKKGNVFIISGLLLIAAALALTGYNLWDDRRAGAESQKVLEQLLTEIDPDPIPEEGRVVGARAETVSIPEVEIEYPDYVLDPHMDMPKKQIDGGSYIGYVAVPSLGWELPVFEYWNYTNLNISPCRYVGSVYLDNMIICAHNYYLHFGALHRLNYGDAVVFTDMDGNVFNYAVMEIETLGPYALEEMVSGDWDLTLFTCTVGGAARVTVRCVRV